REGRRLVPGTGGGAGLSVCGLEDRGVEGRLGAFGGRRPTNSGSEFVSGTKANIPPTLRTVCGSGGPPSKITKPRVRNASSQAISSVAAGSARQRIRGRSASVPSHSRTAGQS